MPSYKGSSRFAKSTSNKRSKPYSSDNGFISDGSDNEDVPERKRAKKGENGQNDKAGAKKGDDEDRYWELSNKRRATVSKYSGQDMIGIREYYEKDGEMLPGKKGISLTVGQFVALVEAMPEIIATLKERGAIVPGVTVSENLEPSLPTRAEHRASKAETRPLKDVDLADWRGDSGKILSNVEAWRPENNAGTGKEEKQLSRTQRELMKLHDSDSDDDVEEKPKVVIVARNSLKKEKEDLRRKNFEATSESSGDEEGQKVPFSSLGLSPVRKETVSSRRRRW